MTANTDENGNQEKDKEPKRKRQPLYLNWQLWLAVSVGLILATVGLVMSFGPVAIIVPIGVMATVVGSTAGPIIEAWSKINEKLKEVKDKAERAEEKALLEGKRNTEIEKKADKAASTAVVLAGRVDVNTERTDLLDKRYEIISDMAYQLTENLQQERDKSEIKITKLEILIENLIKQNQEQQQQINRLKENHQREIAELKEQIRLMGVEKSSDKEKIVLLESQVKQLQDRVKELEDREGKLTAENEQLKQINYELRIDPRMRATDTLTGLSAEAEAKLNRLESERKQEKNKEQEQEQEQQES